MKTSFAVAYHEKKVVIIGVTSIMPNFNSVLIQTESKENYLIEQGLNTVTLNTEFYVPNITEFPEDYEILDYREK